MKQFFKYIFATLVGLALFTVIGFFILIGIFAGAVASASAEKKVEIEPNSILKLDLNYSIPEHSRTAESSTMKLVSGGLSALKPKTALGITELLATLKKAEADKKIKGIYLELGVNENGYATLSVIREALAAFKKSGKFIYAYGTMATQKSYYVSSVADKIILNPSGGMEISGFGREIMYYKNAFDKLGIEVQDFHCGQFKSAIEPYLRDKMSEPNREQLTALYSDIYQHFLVQIGEARKIDTATLNAAINNLKAFLPEDALELHLVDELGYYDQLVSETTEKAGVENAEKFKFTDFEKYASSLKENDGNSSSNKIAVIYAEGEIVDGKGETETIGGDKFAELIRNAREKEEVKAIVLRVNSPGGSALASDVMWREITLAKKAKPVVVSFGDVAASGGYFISCNSDRIFAEPYTITGSIGIFGLVPNMKKLLNDKLGITTDAVEVTKHGAFNMVTNPFDAEEHALIQRQIEKGYREFKLHVAEGRGRDTAYIETIAQGHVYTGTQGLANGLVDEIGGLDKAIKFAAEKAKLNDYAVKSYPQEKEFAEQLQEFFGEAKASIIKSEIGEEQYELYSTLKSLREAKGMQMRLMYDLK